MGGRSGNSGKVGMRGRVGMSGKGAMRCVGCFIGAVVEEEVEVGVKRRMRWMRVGG